MFPSVFTQSSTETSWKSIFSCTHCFLKKQLVNNCTFVKILKSVSHISRKYLCHNRGGSAVVLGGLKSVNRSPNFGVTIFLYVVGTLLVFMAIVLLLQAFGVVVPQPAIYALVLLAIGFGILAAIRRRA